MSLKDLIKARFTEQKIKTEVPNTCPFCGKKIKFNFEHTQNTTVDTKLVEITKGE